MIEGNAGSVVVAAIQYADLVVADVANQPMRLIDASRPTVLQVVF
jgi:hypothetical protein